MPWLTSCQALVNYSINGGVEFGQGRTYRYPQGRSARLGLQSIARDLGIQLSLCILSDASAAIGISRRRGLGKVRHLATADLWMQDRICKGDFALEKVAGADKPSDILTKHVDRAIMNKTMSTLGLHYEDGRAESAPAIP